MWTLLSRNLAVKEERTGKGWVGVEDPSSDQDCTDLITQFVFPVMLKERNDPQPDYLLVPDRPYCSSNSFIIPPFQPQLPGGSNFATITGFKGINL